jgi:hypothetical protein
MYVAASKQLATERSEAIKRIYGKEFVKGRLGKVYELFELSEEIANMFKGKFEKYLGILFSDKSSVRIYLATDKEIEKRVWTSSPLSTGFKILLYSIHFSAKNNLLEKSMDTDRFREEVTKYDSELYQGSVTSALRRRWLRENIFRIEGESIKLIYPLKEVLII